MIRKGRNIQYFIKVNIFCNKKYLYLVKFVFIFVSLEHDGKSSLKTRYPQFSYKKPVDLKPQSIRELSEQFPSILC